VNTLLLVMNYDGHVTCHLSSTYELTSGGPIWFAYRAFAISISLMHWLILRKVVYVICIILYNVFIFTITTTQ
jgi:hypothetical protein